MPWTFYDSSGRKLNTASTLIDNLDIDGATDIGAAIVDADLFIIDDGAGGTNRKTAASRIKTYAGVTQADEAALEAETDEDTYAPPDLIKHSPGVAKFFVRIAAAGTIIATSHNVASITDTGTGNRRIVIATDFAAITWTVVSSQDDSTNTAINIETPGSTFAVGSVDVTVRDTDGNALADFASGHAGFGAQ
jgi:hypothetical protein